MSIMIVILVPGVLADTALTAAGYAIWRCWGLARSGAG